MTISETKWICLAIEGFSINLRAWDKAMIYLKSYDMSWMSWMSLNFKELKTSRESNWSNNDTVEWSINKCVESKVKH